MGVFSSITNGVVNAGVFAWDAGLAVYNLVTPSLAKGSVVPAGKPGHGGVWPEYVPPKEGDSRSSCPALNAMANHGILPHDGKNITFVDLNHRIRETFNFAPTFCFFVPNFSAQMLNKNYSTDTFDLADLNLHNGIEHDASLTRDDLYHQPDQGKPNIPIIKGLLDSATGVDAEGDKIITIPDLSRYSGFRRAQAKANNPQFSLSFFHKMFGSSNSSTMLKFWGGKVKDLEALLYEERLPQGWEPLERSRMGLTITAFNATVLQVEFGIPKTIPGIVKDFETEGPSDGTSVDQAGASSSTSVNKSTAAKRV